MRVLVVSAWEPAHRTEGGSLILANCLPHWAARHELRVLCAGRAAGDVVDERTVPGVPVTSYGRSRTPAVDYLGRRMWGIAHGEPPHVRWVLRPSLLAAVRKVIDSGWPDIVHLVGWGTAPLWRLATPNPTVHMPIDPWSAGLRNRRLPAWRVLADAGTARAVRRHERRHYPHLGRIVVVAPHDAEDLSQSIPRATVDVVVNGVDPGPEPDGPSDAPVIAFHGAFEAQANVDAAAMLVREVLPLVQRDIPDARALIIGRDPPPELTALASRDVMVTGAVPDIRQALRGAAVHVDPMFTGTGLKNKVLEAMAAGLPVLATPLALSGIGSGPGTITGAYPRWLRRACGPTPA